MYQIKTTGPLHNALTPVITGRDSEQVLPVFTNWKRTSQFKTPWRWYSGCRPLQQIVAQRCSGWLHLSLLGGYAESGDCSNDAASLLFSGMSLGAWGSWSFFQRWQMLPEKWYGKSVLLPYHFRKWYGKCRTTRIGGYANARSSLSPIRSTFVASVYEAKATRSTFNKVDRAEWIQLCCQCVVLNACLVG